MKARDVVVAALRKIGVVAEDDPATAAQIELGVEQLGLMLQTWSNRQIAIFQTSEMAVTLTTAGSYVLSPIPVRIHGARLRRNGIDTPMQPLTRREYDNLPLKTSTGLPTTYYLDVQSDTATLYIWPLLAAAAGETLRLTYERRFAELDQSDTVPVLPEWTQAVIYNLGDILSDDFEVDVPKVTARADMMLRDALAVDREGSVFFAGPDA